MPDIGESEMEVVKAIATAMSEEFPNFTMIKLAGPRDSWMKAALGVLNKLPPEVRERLLAS